MKKFKVQFSIAVLSLFSLVFWLRFHPHFLKDIFQNNLQVPKKVLFCALIFSLAHLLAQGLRFWFVLPRGILWSHSLKIFILGQGMNAFLPARIGDWFKVVALEKQKEGFLGRAKSVFVVDKGSDLLAFSLLLGGMLPFWVQRFLDPELKWKLYGLLGGLVVLLVAGFFLRGSWKKVVHARSFRWSLVFGIFAWCLECLGIFSLCGVLPRPPTFYEAFWVLVVLNLGIAVPISVANLGTFEASMAFGLSRLGLSFSEGLVLAGMHHFIQLVAMVSGLLFVLIKDVLGLAWKSFQGKA
jgi:hypothetical protein